MIVTLTGASAAGKTTIEKRLRNLLPEIKPVVSYTTRSLRDTDLPGNYISVLDEIFLEMKRRREFIWDVSLYGNRYGTALKSIEETALEPESIFLMVLEPDSVRTLHLLAQKNKLDLLSFHILSPSPDILRERLKVRKESPEQIERRITESAKWDEKATQSDVPYVIVENPISNDGIPEAAVRKIIQEINRRKSAK